MTISTSPTSCTAPAMGAAMRMPLAHRRWSLSPSTGSRSRMAVASWCSTTTETRMPAKAPPHSTPAMLFVQRGAGDDRHRDADHRSGPRRREPRVQGGSPGQADDDPGVADQVGQHVPAEQREVEHDDEEAPGGPGETRHGAHPRRVGTGAGRPSAHRCDPVDRRQPRHADRRPPRSTHAVRRRSGKPPSPRSTGPARSAGAPRCPPTVRRWRRRPGG